MGKIVCYGDDGKPLGVLYQWDTKQVITIRGISIPPVPVLHMCNRFSEYALVVIPEVSGDDLIVTLPNVLLQRPGAVLAYVYQDTGEVGSRTICTIRMPVVPRPRPDDYIDDDNVEYLTSPLPTSG